MPNTFIVPAEEISDFLDRQIRAERERARNRMRSALGHREYRRRGCGNRRAPERCYGCGLRFRPRGTVDATGQTRVHAGRGRCSTCLQKMCDQEADR